jgi:hypothetical protein
LFQDLSLSGILNIWQEYLDEKVAHKKPVPAEDSGALVADPR